MVLQRRWRRHRRWHHTRTVSPGSPVVRHHHHHQRPPASRTPRHHALWPPRGELYVGMSCARSVHVRRTRATSPAAAGRRPPPVHSSHEADCASDETCAIPFHQGVGSLHGPPWRVGCGRRRCTQCRSSGPSARTRSSPPPQASTTLARRSGKRTRTWVRVTALPGESCERDLPSVRTEACVRVSCPLCEQRASPRVYVGNAHTARASWEWAADRYVPQLPCCCWVTSILRCGWSQHGLSTHGQMGFSRHPRAGGRG